MQTYWTLSFISTFLSMALLVLVMGQYQTLTSLTMKIKRMETQSEQLFKEFASDKLLATRLGNQMNTVFRSLRDLQSSLANSSREMVTKTEEYKACQSLKKKQTDQLANQEKELSKVKGTVKAESDAWKQEIRTLNARLSANSPICDYVKRNKQSEKLCVTTRG